jgi:hypothetical protein
MPDNEEMNINERRKYLKLVRPRYAGAKQEERRMLLTEMKQVTGLHRKSLIRLMNMPSLERARSKPRLKRRRYGPAVEDVVRVVWESLDYICAERLTPGLLETARQLALWEELRLTPEVKQKLSSISRATVQRLLMRFEQDTPKLPRRKPQPNRLLREVPMERLKWDISLPGSFEVDLVHHCGPMAAGDYLYTLQLVDITTGWSERVAILGRSQEAMVKGFRKVQERLPFAISHLHPDNGSEFFNDHLIRYFGEEVTGLRLSRSRPYHKNDNRFVEQKNSTLVRAYVGYERLEGIHYAALNALYDKLWLYYNLFQPVLRMVAKEVRGAKLYRKHDRAKTPYQRLLDSRILSDQQKTHLAALYSTTNPRQLRKAIYEDIRHLRNLPPTPHIPNTTQTKEAALVR